MKIQNIQKFLLGRWISKIICLVVLSVVIFVGSISMLHAADLVDIRLNSLSQTIVIHSKFQFSILDKPNRASAIWSSSKESVATVSTRGNVTGHKEGTSTITCTISSKGKKIKVLKAVVTVKRPEVQSIKLTPSSMTLSMYESRRITAKVLPEQALIGNVVWVSSNPLIVYVSSNGSVTGISPGTGVVSAYTENGTFNSCVVTVKSIPVKTVSLNKSSVSLKKGEKEQLKVSITPNNAWDREVAWSVSNEKVAKVDGSGMVYAVSSGLTTVTATSSNGKKASCKITVIKEEAPKIDDLVVVIDGDFVVGEAQAKISFSLDKIGEMVVIEILNEKDEILRIVPFGSGKKGKNEGIWDGLDNQSMAVPSGSYRVQINADGRKKRSGAMKIISKGAFEKGNGSQDNPYRIASFKDLNQIRDYNKRYFLQTNDIICELENFLPLFTSKKQFEGFYDGGGYSIKGLSIDNRFNGYTGLFAAIGKDGVIKNVSLLDCNIKGGKYTGGIVGKNSGTISNCQVDGVIHGDTYVAGISGFNVGSISNCGTTALITGTLVGGVSIDD